MDGYIGVERGFEEDVDIDVGIGVFLPMVGFVDTSTCWRVSSGKIFGLCMYMIRLHQCTWELVFGTAVLVLYRAFWVQVMCMRLPKLPRSLLCSLVFYSAMAWRVPVPTSTINLASTFCFFHRKMISSYFWILSDVIDYYSLTSGEQLC